jgi:hypothetical protein
VDPVQAAELLLFHLKTSLSDGLGKKAGRLAVARAAGAPLWDFQAQVLEITPGKFF